MFTDMYGYCARENDDYINFDLVTDKGRTTKQSCMDYCTEDETCKAFNFNNKSNRCSLLEEDQYEYKGFSPYSCSMRLDGITKDGQEFIKQTGECRTKAMKKPTEFIEIREGLDYKECESLCSQDKSCGAFEHHSDRGQCSLI